MPGEMIRIKSQEGPSFQAYLALPAGRAKVPGIVLASSVHGIDADHRSMADEIAGKGFIALAPDLFWRTVPGPLARDDERTKSRAQPRLEKIRTGEKDMADALAHLRTLSQFNGQAVAAGFCYGGPYAILGPKRLGYAAGVSCHGSQMWDYVAELDGVQQPVAIIWGDKDHAATPEVRKQVDDWTKRSRNVEHHVFPGVNHGYMLKGNTKSFDAKVYEFSMSRMLAILEALRG